MTLKEILKNPKVLSAVLSLMFISAFAMGPYTSIGSMVVTTLGITTLLVWGNIQINGKIGEKLEKNRVKITEIIDTHIPISASTVKIVEHLQPSPATAAIQSAEATPTEVDVVIVSSQLSTMDEAALAKSIAAETYKAEIEQLSQHNNTLQIYDKRSNIVGTICLAAGSSLQIASAALFSDSTAVTLQRSGSGVFTAGFAVAAVIHWFLFNKMTEQYNCSKQIKKSVIKELEQDVVSTARP